jgi:hypothetical protein
MDQQKFLGVLTTLRPLFPESSKKSGTMMRQMATLISGLEEQTTIVNPEVALILIWRLLALSFLCRL